MWRTLFFILIVNFIGLTSLTVERGAAQTPNCSDRPTYISQPWIHQDLSCLEEVINDPVVGELGFTALAVSPDETLYAARPYTGEVIALTDTDGDLLPDTPRVVASGLTLPNGLAYHDGSLYIVGSSRIDRLTGENLETLVDDLPSGGGFWTGGIAVRDRIYVSTGAPCDQCVSDDPARGAILSYALDGSDRQIVAAGLRFPADLAFFDDELYVVDSAPDALFDTPDLDELNRVTEGANFGFPVCVLPDTPECADYTPPIVTFPTASTPIGLAAYNSDALPMLTNSLLVVLSGSYNDLQLRGYRLVAVRFDENGAHYEPVMPVQSPSAPGSERFTADEMSYRGSGFFPHRPLDVAVSSRGWVYISIGGGRIIALRPKG